MNIGKRLLVAVAAMSLLAAGAMAADKIPVGFILMSRTTEFLVGEEYGALQEAKKYPDVNLIIIDGESSSEKQVSAAEDLMTTGVKALVLNPYNSAGIAAAVKKANE